MNRQFFEFWGDFFTNVARGQKQFEEMTAWMQHGFTGTRELNELFQRCYGLAPSGTDARQPSPVWQTAIDDFQKNFAEMASQWGWVSETEHQKALNRCRDLEQQVQQQQKTIGELRTLLLDKGLGHSELLQHLKNSMQEQSDQFHSLMQSLQETYRDNS
ncbi:MAG: hypothetical protein ACK5PS_06760 [Desulfopila sp.]